MLMMDVVEANSLRSQARWTPLAVSTEAIFVLLVTAVFVQLKFSYVVPRIVLVLSRVLSFSVHKPECPEGQEEKREALNSLGPGVSSLDDESARREIRSIYQSKIYDILGIIPDKDVASLKIKEKYVVNSRGLEIFSKSWLPKDSKPKAVIFFCHGYGDTCTFFFENIARKLASKNFAVFAMDYPGSGLSQGLHGYFPRFEDLVSDVLEHYVSIKEQEQFKGLPVFLLGESMGGAVALKAHLRMPDAWDGAILVAPMCKRDNRKCSTTVKSDLQSNLESLREAIERGTKLWGCGETFLISGSDILVDIGSSLSGDIAEDMCPPWYLIDFLKVLARIIPKAKLVPSGNIAEIGFRDPKKRSQANQNLIAYVGRPRLGTALALLTVSLEIEKKLDKISLPLLILHGGADRVTDPAISRLLYEQASTPDKTLHLYDNAWHAVLEGEPDEMVDRAIGDIVDWLDARTASIESTRT